MSEIGNNKTVNTKLLLKSGMWYTVSNFLTRSLVFLTTPIFTRLMTNKQYGDFSIFASWQSIFLIICGIEIYATLNRARFDYKEKKEQDSYISSCLILSTVITAVFFLIYLIFDDFFYELLLLDRKYIFAMFTYLFAYPAFAMFQAKQRIEYRYKLSAALSLSLLIIASAASVTFVCLWSEDRLFGRIIGQYVPYVIVGVILYLSFLKKSITIKIESWKYALKMGVPLVFSFLGSQILLYSDRIVVQHLNSSNEVAFLSLATTCAHIMLIFVQTLNNAWAPWFYDKLNNGEYRSIRKVFRVYMWFIVICTFCVLMIGPEVVWILGGQNYNESVYILPANMLCGIFTALTAQFVNFETFYKKTHYSAVLTLIAAVINIVLDIICVMQWGYRAACYVTVFCQILLITMHYIMTMKMNIQKILSLRDLAAEILVSAALIPLALIFYQAAAVRWGVIIGILILISVIAIVKRKKIIGFLKKYEKM